MKKAIAGISMAGAVSLSPLVAVAHVEVSSGPGFATTTQEITFGVGHGCSGADTYRVRIEIPPSVTSVRAETSDFGKATVEKDAAGLVTAVTWQKPDQDLLDGDTNYYKLVLRMKVPDAPFTKLYFPAHQTCKKLDGTTTVVDWVVVPPATEGEPAPAVSILPIRKSGWNKVKVPVAIPDLKVFFSDAAIVWKGTAAFSSNPATTELIAATEGVTPLTALAANDEIWVKY